MPAEIKILMAGAVGAVGGVAVATALQPWRDGGVLWLCLAYLLGLLLGFTVGFALGLVVAATIDLRVWIKRRRQLETAPVDGSQ